MTSNRVSDILSGPELLDRLADAEHERWAHWQRYVHGQCEQRDDGALIIPADLVARWEGQIATPYAALSETEKESDRDQVRRYLPIIAEALQGEGPTRSRKMAKFVGPRAVSHPTDTMGG